MNNASGQRLKLQIELVPGDLWNFNLRSENGIGPGGWDKLRRTLMEQSGGRCVICGSTDHPQGHEVWDYREEEAVGTAVLLRVEINCCDCHNVHHWGRTTNFLKSGQITTAEYNRLKKHFCEVNGCRQEDFDTHWDQSWAEWERRNSKKWQVDWGAFAPQVEEAETARKLWAERNGRRLDPDDDLQHQA